MKIGRREPALRRFGGPRRFARGDDHRGVAVFTPVELGETGLELGRECIHGRKALCRILLERPVDRRRNAKRHVAADVQDIRGRLLDVLHRDGDEAFARERDVAGQQLVEHDSERVHVGVHVDRLAARLLRGDVVRGSEHGPRLRDAALHVERARDAEVRDLRAAVTVQQHVLRLDVPVDEAVLVCERERTGDVDCDLERLAHLETSFADDELLEVLAVDVLEDDVLAAFFLTPVDHRDDARVLELRHGAGFALEALDEVVVFVVLLVQDLQRHVALEERVVSPVDAGHAAVADDLLQLVSSCDRLSDHGRKLPTLHGRQAWDQLARARRSRRPTHRPPHQIP